MGSRRRSCQRSPQTEHQVSLEQLKMVQKCRSLCCVGSRRGSCPSRTPTGHQVCSAIVNIPCVVLKRMCAVYQLEAAQEDPKLGSSHALMLYTPDMGLMISHGIRACRHCTHATFITTGLILGKGAYFYLQLPHCPILCQEFCLSHSHCTPILRCAS